MKQTRPDIFHDLSDRDFDSLPTYYKTMRAHSPMYLHLVECAAFDSKQHVCESLYKPISRILPVWKGGRS